MLRRMRRRRVAGNKKLPPSSPASLVHHCDFLTLSSRSLLNVHCIAQIHRYKYAGTNKQIQIHKYKYTDTNTNTQIQIHRYKYADTNTQIQIHRYKYADTNIKSTIVTSSFCLAAACSNAQCASIAIHFHTFFCTSFTLIPTAS